MATVDNKVVNMKFNNKQFEDGISTTLNSLTKLKSGLNLSGAAKSFDEVERAADKVTLNGIAKSLETISGRFTTLGIMGARVLQNITDAAMRAGTSLVKSLTVSPMLEGLQEYETQINAIQTIMSNTASKGTTLTQVNDALNELNKYADMTIYNFTEMTRNIGTFTAAGVDLDTSVNAIKGIANLAAASGSTSQQASTAMYQLSQALSSGTVKLQDWNSVVNAGMGGQLFQDALTETARVHGIGIDKMIKEEGSFRETLSEGWLTSSILTETLSKFTGDLTQEQLLSMGYTQKQAEEIIALGSMANDAATKVKTLTQLGETLGEAVGSGWAQTWQILIGDFDEAKELFTGISDALSDIINESSDARNNMLKGWKDLGGRTKLIDAVAVAWHNVYDVVSAFTRGLKSMIPAMTSEKLFALTEGFEKLVYRLTASDEALEQIEKVGNGVGVVLNGMWTAVKLLAAGFVYVVDALSPLVGLLLTVGEFLGDLLSVMLHSVQESEKLGSSLDRFVKIMDRIKNAFKGAINAMNNALKSWDWLSVMYDIDGSLPSLGLFSGVLTLIEKALDGVGVALAYIGPKIKGFVKSIGSGFVWLGEVIMKALGNLNSNNVKNIGIVALLGYVAIKVRDFIKNIRKGLDEAGGILEGVSEILDGVKGSLEAWQNNLKADTIMKLAIAIGILAASLLVISTIDPVKLIASLSAMGVMFAELIVAMSMLTKINKGLKGQVGIVATSAALILFSTALLILAGAIKVVSTIPATSMVKGLYGIAAMIGMMVGASKLLETQSKGMVKTSAALILLAIAMKMLVKPVIQLAAVPFNSLVKGLGALAVMLGAMVLFTQNAKFGKNAISTGVGLVLLAKAIGMLADALVVVAAIKLTSLIKATYAISAIILVLAAFTKLSGGKNMISTGIGLVFLAQAMETISKVLERLAAIPFSSLVKSLAAFGVALGVVTLAINMLPVDGVARGAGLWIVAQAIKGLADALTTLSVIPFTSLAKAVIAMAYSLTIMVAAMMAAKGSLAGAAAILVVAAALNVLTPALRAFSKMTTKEIIKSMVVLAGTFAIFGIAGYALAPVAPVLLTLAAAIGVFGLASLAVGAGIMALSVGLTTLAAGGAASAKVLKIMMLEIATAFPELLTTMANALAEFVIALAQRSGEITAALVTMMVSILNGIIELTPKIVEAFGAIMIGLLAIIVENVPLIVDAGFQLITSFLSSIRDNIGPITQIAIDIIINFINTVSANLPKIVDSAFGLIISFINSLANTIRERSPEIRAAGVNLITALLSGARDTIGGALDIGKRLVNFLFNGITEIAKGAWALGKSVIQKVIDGIKSIISSAVELGKTLVRNVIDGIKSFFGLGKKAGSDMATGVLSGVKGVASGAFNVGKNMMQGMTNGIKSMANNLKNSAKNVVDGAVSGIKNFLGIKSPSRLFMSIGNDTGEGFVIGLDQMKDSAVETAVGMGSSVTDAIRDSIESIDSIADDISPVITPVIDLTDVEEGMRSVDAAITETSKLGMETSIDLARKATAETTPRPKEQPAQENKETVVNLTQNNYSPETLSTYDIYRQTKELARELEGKMKPA